MKDLAEKIAEAAEGFISKHPDYSPVELRTIIRRVIKNHQGECICVECGNYCTDHGEDSR